RDEITVATSARAGSGETIAGLFLPRRAPGLFHERPQLLRRQPAVHHAQQQRVDPPRAVGSRRLDDGVVQQPKRATLTLLVRYLTVVDDQYLKMRRLERRQFDGVRAQQFAVAAERGVAAVKKAGRRQAAVEGGAAVVHERHSTFHLGRLVAQHEDGG